ncbi:ubiquitin-related domain-containing protein [Cladorrhinum sp. PSN259]|nr:ubiquitin-related domain-containing protein [Cladorrhinum sp. PSN259]
MQTASNNSAQSTNEDTASPPPEPQQPETVEPIPSSDEAGAATTTAADQVLTTPKGKDKDDEPLSSSSPPASPPPPVEKTPTREADSLSIGPSPDETSSSPASVAPANATCTITLLLPTGARHPYKIDEKYLTKRGVEIPEPGDPFSISVYKLKELILREWREEWDGKPASPSSIRLIHFGKLLDDKEMLKKYQLSKDTPNVVHMSVRPAEMMEEDEGAKGKASSRESRSGREGGGSGCCVIL